MNKLITASLFAVTASLLFHPQTAKAGGDEAAAAIGGFIGGLIVGSALDNDHRHARYDDHAPVGVSARVVVGRDFDRNHHEHGYWDWTRTQVWIPGTWLVRFDDCGRRVRYFERGHYEYRRERVWVATGRYGRCDICR